MSTSRSERPSQHSTNVSVLLQRAAAAGNPNIADELLNGKQLGERTYKVHLDGYNQLDFITGKGPSVRHEIFYFTEGP